MLKKLSFLIPLLTVLLFIGNYHICEFFYKDDISKWWNLRTALCAINFGLALYCSKMDMRDRLTLFFVNVGIGFSVSDIVDRLVYDITTFTKADILMIIITVMVSFYESYLKPAKKENG